MELLLLLPPARINRRDSTGGFSQSRLLIRAGPSIYYYSDNERSCMLLHVHLHIHSFTHIFMCISVPLTALRQAKDIPRARAVYRACLKVIPNKLFTFGKIWILAAQLEVRQKDLAAARKILGMAIGTSLSGQWVCSGCAVGRAEETFVHFRKHVRETKNKTLDEM